MTKNENLLKEVVPTESEIIVNYVGNSLNPDDENITVQQIVKFLLSNSLNFY